MTNLNAGDRVYIAATNKSTGDETRRYGTVKKTTPIDVLDMVDICFDDAPNVTAAVDLLLVFKEGETYTPHITDYTVFKAYTLNGYDVCPKCNRVGRLVHQLNGRTKYVHKIEGIFDQTELEACEVEEERWNTGSPMCAWCGSDKVSPVSGMQGPIQDTHGVYACFDCGGPNNIQQAPGGWYLSKPKNAAEFECKMCHKPVSNRYADLVSLRLAGIHIPNAICRDCFEKIGSASGTIEDVAFDNEAKSFVIKFKAT